MEDVKDQKARVRKVLDGAFLAPPLSFSSLVLDFIQANANAIGNAYSRGLEKTWLPVPTSDVLYKVLRASGENAIRLTEHHLTDIHPQIKRIELNAELAAIKFTFHPEHMG